MKIGMISRSTLYKTPGGDTTMVDMTAKYLRKLGVEVDIFLANEKINYTDYDLLHFFNIIRPDDILPHIKKSNTKFVVTIIFVDYLEYERKNRTGIYKLISNLFNRDQIEYMKAIYRWIKNGDRIQSNYYLLNGHRKSVRLIASKAALLLPNSHNEYNRFVDVYKVHTKYKKVVNSIDLGIFSEVVNTNPNYSNHVLCVGRIEGRKNQLNLIRALINTNLHLTIVGKPSINHQTYYDDCLAEAADSPNIHFVTHISHDELAGMYKAAKVHVLASWFETTGLSTLEAGVLDCNVVVSKKGDTEEYFQDMAYYCEPDDIESIKVAVLKAYNEPINPKFKSYIKQNYTWEDTATQTLEGYQVVLS